MKEEKFTYCLHKSVIESINNNYVKRSRKDFTEHYYYIVNIVCWQQAIDKRYTRDSFVPVNYKHCKDVVSKEELKSILSNLISWGVLECDNHYIVGIKSKGYRVAETHRNAMKVLTMQDKLINKKIFNHRDRIAEENIQERGDLWRSLNMVRIDKVRAMKYIRNHYALESGEYQQRLQSITKLDTQQFFMIKDNQGRIHSNITSLGKDIRQFLITEEGELFTEIDIANSQPLFFYCALEKADTINKTELEDYKKLVLSGKFYDELNDTGMSRDKFKKMFYVDVLFGLNKNWKGKIATIFENRWPSIYAFVRKQKEKDHNKIAIMLQKEESNFIINICCNEFLKRTGYEFVVTIHDSLVVLSNHGVEAQYTMEEMFKKHYGFVPKITVK